MKELVEEMLNEPNNPENYCTVCGELIEVKKGVVPKEGEKYYIVRENRTERVFVATEKYIHGGCFDEYIETQD